MDNSQFKLPILAIIPVRNEAATIASVIARLREIGIDRVRVVDNGSDDGSADLARAAGAEVVVEPQPGYGRACWRGLQHLPQEVEWILFADGDGSDDLGDLPHWFQLCDRADVILGDRRATSKGKAALTPVQNFGNALATNLMAWGWGHRYGDLGPLRLVRREALEAMQISYPNNELENFGWTVEMQVRAVELGLRIVELPVGYFPRQGGQSKISGTLKGSFAAGMGILATLARLYLRRRGWQLSALLLLSGCLLMLPWGDFQTREAVPHFWVGAAVMGVGFTLAWRLRAIASVPFWSVTWLSRLLLLPMFPGDDIWRYLWEGHIQTFGFSPYEYPPNADLLAPLRTPWWELINHPDVTAIYPPLTQWGFRALATLAPTVILFKLAFVLADVATCWLLARRWGRERALVYAWNPLIIYSFAGGGHYDSWFILPLVAAWVLQKAEGFGGDRGSNSSQVQTRENRSPRLRALLLGISVALKWVSLPIASFLAWQQVRQWRWRGAIAVAILSLLPTILAALSFCDRHSCSLVPTESTFVTYGRSAEFFPYLLGQLWEASKQANWIYLIPLGIWGIVLLWRVQEFGAFCQGYFTALLLVSPIVHAWYFTWLVPFAVATNNLGVRLVSLSAFVYFALPYRQALGSDRWFLEAEERWLLWLPFILGWLWSLRSSSAKSQPRQAS